MKLQQINLKNIGSIALMVSILTGCAAAENSIRGVPESLWKHLNAEQKQLIIDRSFEEEFGKK